LNTIDETYFAYPPSKSTDIAIIILTDVIGNKFNNAQLIADQFAANGFFVAVPDLFKGDPLPLNRPDDFDFDGWRKKHSTEYVDPIVEATIKELKETYGVKKLGTIGYCFGAKYVVRFLKKGITDAGYVAHPSYVLDEELKAIEGPLSIAAAGESISTILSR
jgi:dienelactone hydrolase